MPLKKLIDHSVMDRVKRPKVERFVGKFLKQSEATTLFETVKGHKLELGVIFGRSTAYVGQKLSGFDGIPLILKITQLRLNIL